MAANDHIAPDLIPLEHAPWTFSGIINHNISSMLLFSDAASLLPNTDLFYKKFDFVVQPTDNPLQNITLDRIVGQLEVDIFDATATTHASDININLEPATDKFHLGTGMPDSVPSQFSHYLTRINNNVFSALSLNTINPITVYIYYPDKTTGDMLRKIVTGVHLAKNQKTVLSGYLYGAPPAGSNTNVGVGLNNTWNPVIDSIKF